MQIQSEGSRGEVDMLAAVHVQRIIYLLLNLLIELFLLIAEVESLKNDLLTIG